jgi:hypothetical protein
LRPVLCSGWRGRTTLTRQATIWVYGEGPIQLHLRAPGPIRLRLLADGRLLDMRRFSENVIILARLSGMRWHPLLLDASASGLRLGELTF